MMGGTSYDDDIEETNLSERFEDVITEARSVGINPTQIIQEIQSRDVESAKRFFIEKIQQVMEKYGLHASSIEIGSYPDPYIMDGNTNVRLMLSPRGIEERYHDGRSNSIQLNGHSVSFLHNSKRILLNLLKELIEATRKYKAATHETESALDYVSNLCLDRAKDCSTIHKVSAAKRKRVKSRCVRGGR